MIAELLLKHHVLDEFEASSWLWGDASTGSMGASEMVKIT